VNKATSNHSRCGVALLVDVETGHRNAAGCFVPERGSVEAHVLKALRSRHPGTAIVPFGPDIGATIGELRRLAPRIVFNLTEWIDGNRRLDYAIAALLEILQLRFTGAGPRGLQLCRDKVLSKRIVAQLGIEVPRYFTSTGRLPVHDQTSPPFPLLVKPQFGDGSDAIGKVSLVATVDQLRRRVRTLCRNGHAPVMCEEFIPGRDLYVSLVGNPPQVLPPIEMVIGSNHPRAPRFATYRVKNDNRYAGQWRIRYRRAALDQSLLAAIATASRKIFRALELRDYARLDFRLTADCRPFFIEANPNPDLSPHTFGSNVCLTGVDHRDLILRIVAVARRRR
jgi:D-alanine-D-alanine ligase